MPFRAGDVVRIPLTGDEIVLGCDQFGDVVIPAGWAEVIYFAADCELVTAADDELRLRVLRVSAIGPRGWRQREAQRALGGRLTP